MNDQQQFNEFMILIKNLMNQKAEFREELYKVIKCLAYAEGQLMHAGYTKNAAPVVRKEIERLNELLGHTVKTDKGDK